MALLLILVFILGVQVLVLNIQTLLLCHHPVPLVLPLVLMVQI